jgi:hypothetical protein
MLLITTKCMSIHHRKGRSSVYTIHRTPPGSVVTSEEGPFSTKRTGEETSVVTGEETSKKSKREEEKNVRGFPKDQRDRMFDEFVALFGTPVGGMKGRYGTAVTDALKAGIVPAELGPARRRYLDHPKWKNAVCNPQALVNNWNTFGPAARLQDAPPEARAAYQGVS